MIVFDRHSLEKTVSELKSYEGKNTELISLYVSSSKKIEDVYSHLSNEYSEAKSIKSKRTRKNVRSALKSLKSRIKKFEEIPENGLVMFSGKVNTERDKFSIRTVIIDDLPYEVQSFIYSCDSEFDVEPLEGMLESKSLIGLIVLDRRNAQIGFLKRGGNIEVKESLSSLVPGKHTKGGQSQVRFERLRKEAIHKFYKKIGDRSNEIFKDELERLDGILIGGPSPSKDKFMKKDYLEYRLEDKVLGVLSVSDTKEKGLEELVERGEELIKEEKLKKERNVLNKFFNRLRKDEKVAYGINEVLKAVDYGAIDTLILSDSLDKNEELKDKLDTRDVIKEFKQKAKNKGSNVVVVSGEFDKKRQFEKGFGGVGALLRFSIN